MPDHRPANRNSIWPYALVAVLSLVGLADAIYLTVQDLTGQNLRCTIITGCAEVLGSKYAHIAGIPLAVVGAAAYFSVFSLAVLIVFGYAFARPLLQLLVAIMFVMTLWLLYLQAYVIHHFCQYCLLSALVTTVIALIVIFATIAQRRASTA
ncbi:MAG TPA: vitamin K epoxide reductase family protein [Pyrinomonadaceae bacterium]|nr:vitamin K epoxide reductase family protein [Pyrinomonadaceae bacterium]